MKDATGTVSDASQADSSTTDVSLETQQASQTPNETSSASKENPSDDDLIGDLTNMDDLERILNESGKPSTERKAPKAKTEGDDEDTDEDDDDDVAEEEEEQAEGADKTDPKGEKLARNFRFNKVDDPKRAKFLQILRRNQDIDPIEAAQKAGYTLPEAQKVTQQQGSTTDGKATQDGEAQLIAAVKPQADNVTALEKDVAELKVKIKEAQAAYNPYGELVIELTEKSEQLTSAKAELNTAKADYLQGQEWQREYDAGFQSAQEKAFARHPEVKTEDSVQFMLVQAELGKALDANPKFTQDPDYPNLIIDRLEAKHPKLFPKKGTAPAKTEIVPGGNKPNKEARELGSKVASGNSTTQSLTTTTEIENAIDDLNFEDLEKLANLAGTQGGKRK